MFVRGAYELKVNLPSASFFVRTDFAILQLAACFGGLLSIECACIVMLPMFEASEIGKFPMVLLSPACQDTRRSLYRARLHLPPRGAMRWKPLS